MPTSSKRRHMPASRSGGSGWPEKHGFGVGTIGLVDVSLAATIAIVPFAMGGREPLGLLLFSLLSSFSFLAWCVSASRDSHAQWHRNALTIPIVAGIAWITVQAVPLPGQVIAAMAPEQARLLPLWTVADAGGLHLGRWPYLSLAPWETQVSLTGVVAGALLFFTLVQRIHSRRQAEFFVKVLALTGGAMSLFALVQLATSNGKFYWVYEHPFTTTFALAKGAFTNRNHFAHFMALSAGPLLWWATSHSEASRPGADRLEKLGRALAVVLLGTVVLAALLSQSRGGLIGLGASSLLTAVLLFRSGRLQGTTVVGLAGAGLAVGLALMAFDDSAVQRRLETLVSGDLNQLDRDSGRREIWGALLKGIPLHAAAGTGLGSHRYAYRLYLENPPEDREYTHAENGYLQVALETGFVGLSIVGIIFLVCLNWCRQGGKAGTAPESAALAAAVSGPIVANLVHSLTDFIWYVPGCMVAVVTCAAVACRVAQLERSARRVEASPSPGIGLLRTFVSATGTVAIAGWMILTLLPEWQAQRPWNTYLRSTLAEASGDEDAQDQDVGYREKLVVQAVHADPFDARIHARAARAYLAVANVIQSRNEMGMPISQIREAASGSEFESEAQRREWLGKVLNASAKYIEKAHRHARRAVELCPLQGGAYLTLADTAFIVGGTMETEEALYAQALTVRPYEPAVLFAAGRRTMLQGEFEPALDQWELAFRRSSHYRKEIIDLIAPFVEPPFLIDRFDPDCDALEHMAAVYQEQGHGQHWATSLAAFSEKAAEAGTELPGKAACELYLRAYRASEELDDAVAARRFAELAAAADPRSIPARRTLGTFLLRQGEFAAAAEHLTWCVKRLPDDRQLNNLAAEATKESLRATTTLPTASAADSDSMRR